MRKREDMGTSSIEWLANFHDDGTREMGETWNPIGGCTAVSDGCDNCYARVLHTMRHEIYLANGGYWPNSDKRMPAQYAYPFTTIQLFEDRLNAPLHWRKPRRCFVNSMSDLFHKDIPTGYIKRVFAVMNQAKAHTFLILTKRPSRAALLKHELIWTPNIGMGTSIEDNSVVWRADKLREIPAFMRFISAEPLLGDLTYLKLKDIDWLIAGAESGLPEDVRTMNIDWVRHLRDNCQENNVAFFYKQDAKRGHKLPLPYLDGRQWIEYPIARKEA